MFLDFHNIQAIEVLWTLIAVVGLCFAVSNFRFATKIVHKLKNKVPRPDPESWVTARFIQIAEGFRFLIQSIHVTLGIIAFLLPPSELSQVPLRFQISAFILRWGLVASATLTAMQSVNSYRLRHFFTSKSEKDSNG